jgi:hypothetical protein
MPIDVMGHKYTTSMYQWVGFSIYDISIDHISTKPMQIFRQDKFISTKPMQIFRQDKLFYN